VRRTKETNQPDGGQDRQNGVWTISTQQKGDEGERRRPDPKECVNVLRKEALEGIEH